LPESAVKQHNREGKIIAVGKGHRTGDGKFVPLSVEVGDVVLLPSFGGQEINMNGDEFLIFREEDILGKVEMTDTPMNRKSVDQTNIPNVDNIPKNV